MTRLPGRRPSLTEEQVRQLQGWAKIGTSFTDVARRLGVSPATVRRYVRGECKTYYTRIAS